MNKIKGTSLKLAEIEGMITIYLDGMYKYSDINEMFGLSNQTTVSILNNQELIETYFEKETFIQLKEKTKIVMHLKDSINNKELIKNHEIRKIIKQDVLYVDISVKKSLNMVMLFLKYEGNIDMINKETKVNRNEIITMLHNCKIKDLLLPEVVPYFENLLQMEEALFDRNFCNVDPIIKKISYMKKVLEYNERTISFILNLPIDTINRILVDAYTLIKCKKYILTDISEEEIKKEKILDIYDVMSNNDLSVREVGEIFNLSCTTISNYMNNDLKQIDINKYHNIQEIFTEINSHTITPRKQIEINKKLQKYLKNNK